MRYSRQGKCINNLQLLRLNSYLETQLSNIVRDCSFHKFNNRGKVTFDDFMNDTIHQSTRSKDDDNQKVTDINKDDDDLANNHDTSNQKLTEDDNESPPTLTTVNKNLNTTTDHSTLEDVDVEGDNNTLSSNDDIDKDNNDDITNQVVT